MEKKPIMVISISKVQELLPVDFNIKLSDELLKRHTWGDVDFSLISSKNLINAIEEVLDDNMFISDDLLKIEAAIKAISYENCYFDLNTIEKY